MQSSSASPLADVITRAWTPEEFGRLFSRSVRSPGAAERAREWALRGQHIEPSAWGERYFYIEDPCDVATGGLLPAGPIRLFPIQRALLAAMLERTGDGAFRWQSIVFSAIKKSGKSRIAAMVDAWVADQFGPYADVFLAANDGKQSGDRLLNCISRSIILNRMAKSRKLMSFWQDLKTYVKLPNGSIIEAIPVDPTGQAGGNPAAVTFSEMWGYRLEHKQRLWSALTLSPTKRGKSFRWVDTYAGYEGESPILETLYHQGLKEGRLYVDWADENGVAYDRILRDLELPLFVYEPGRLIVYWETEPRFPWQTPEYYEEEAANLPEQEFRRVHRNEWVSSEDVYVPLEWWLACDEMVQRGIPLPPLVGKAERMVLGADAAVSGDSFAVVGVTRHPDPTLRDKHVAVRYVQVWYPPPGGKLDFAPIEDEITRLCREYNMVEVAYDPYQLHRTATDMHRERVVYWKEFGQGNARLKADTQLHQLIAERRVHHSGEPELTAHIRNARAKMSTEEENKMRIVKGLTGKVDAAVALSMAADRCLYLQI